MIFIFYVFLNRRRFGSLLYSRLQLSAPASRAGCSDAATPVARSPSLEPLSHQVPTANLSVAGCSI
jgi:hypothetical protein